MLPTADCKTELYISKIMFIGTCSTSIWFCPVRSDKAISYGTRFLIGSMTLAFTTIINKQIKDISQIPMSYYTLGPFEKAAVYLMAGFHEIQMKTIHIQLPKLMSNHLRIR